MQEELVTCDKYESVSILVDESMSFIVFILVVMMPTLSTAFAPPPPPPRRRVPHPNHADDCQMMMRMMLGTGAGVGRRRILSCNSSINNTPSNNDDDADALFDPFLQSPLSFGMQPSVLNNDSDGDDDSTGTVDATGEFRYQSTYAESNDVENIYNPLSSSSSSSSSAYASLAHASSAAHEINTSVTNSNDTTFEFDPLLSPHAYANGIDAGPITSQPAEQSKRDNNSIGAQTTFNPQLQHQQQQQRRIGILLIDHGSKRPASNEHIHAIAKMYEDRLNKATTTTTTISNTSTITSTTTTVVRAAHMEIANPSILDSLRNLFAIDHVAKVICVPYFLSPGRHATEDVPNLIREARRILVDEGVLSLRDGQDNNDNDDDESNESTEKSILVSNALGTQLESMLRAVDNLVEEILGDPYAITHRGNR
ncbi:hypothetical protein ACHAWU_004668 [Discostella pseudostelligera]|uniref:Sirohydrochlorin cobaltochelatase n=1 Tax=Discostella pseudostelligera TaxID=259834 RepID=A0ABD3N5L0_9STRA